MKNMKLIIAVVLAVVVGGAIAGGAVWYMSKGEAHAAESEDGKSDKKKVAKKEKKEKDALPPKYLTVDKVIIMLRPTQEGAKAHYMSADLVITTDTKLEKEAKEQVPLLRSVAVRTLSQLPVDTARSMTIDQFAEALNKAFDEQYEKDEREKPFGDVMIGKLIIE